MVSHCLNVLEIVLWSERPMTVSEIADRLDVPKSTAFRVLQVMMEHDLVIQKPKGPYRPGPKAHALGSVILHTDLASDKVESVMDEIAKATKETVLYAAANAAWPGVLVISERETSHPFRLQSNIGKCLPEKLFGVKLGKPDAKIKKSMPTTDYTTSCDDKAVKCISSVVKDENGDVKGVLALMVAKERLDANKTKTYTALIKKKAAALAE